MIKRIKEWCGFPSGDEETGDLKFEPVPRDWEAPLPNGVYHVIVSTIEPRESAIGTSMMIPFMLKVIAPGPYAGRTIFDTHVLSSHVADSWHFPYRLPKLLHFFHTEFALGTPCHIVQTTGKKELTFGWRIPLKKVEGLTFFVRVQTRVQTSGAYKGSSFTDVVGYYHNREEAGIPYRD